MNEIAVLMHSKFQIAPNWFSAGFAVLVTIYFWWLNIKGMHESSGKALRIMQITTVMVVIFLIWCPLTLLLRGPAQIPPPPTPANIQFGQDALGWFQGTIWPSFAFVAIIVAFGHSLLSMSGFETLAQVYREIAYPKLRNLRITGNIVCIYAAVGTGLITLFAGMIIPDKVRPGYIDNLLGGLAMHLAGPEIFRLGFHVLVVIVGVLILSGAVNTAIIGANGVMKSGSGRWRPGGLVPQTAPPVRDHIAHHQRDLTSSDRHHCAEPRRTCTCWARPMRSALFGASF